MKMLLSGRLIQQAAWGLSLVLATAGARAAGVGFAGKQLGVSGANNDVVDRWRSTGATPKPFDVPVPSDNVYGTVGGVLYSTAAAGALTNPFTMAADPLTFNDGTVSALTMSPAFITLASNGQNTVTAAPSFALLDTPAAAIDVVVADIVSGGALRAATKGTEVSMLDMMVGAGFPSAGLRVGVFMNNSQTYSGTLRISQTAGTGAGTATATVASTGNPDLYFFDITGAQNGDKFTLFLSKSASQPGGGNTADDVVYGGLTFDVLPEPGSLGLLAVVGVGLLARRRRMR